MHSQNGPTRSKSDASPVAWPRLSHGRAGNAAVQSSRRHSSKPNAVSALFHPRDARLPGEGWDGYCLAPFHPGVVHPTQVVMTDRRLRQLCDAGVGSGVHESYQSWIRVRRHLRAPVSNITAFPSLLYERHHHFLSDIEVKAYRVALWLGVSEAREQKPYWPLPHAHPITGWDLLRDLSTDEVPGTLEIARDLGIDHGVYPGTKIAFVATTDLMLRIGYPPNDRLVLWPCKPSDFLNDRGPDKARMHERLLLESTYARSIGAHIATFTETSVSETLLNNLSLYQPTRLQLLDAHASAQFADFVGFFEELAEVGAPLRDCCAFSAQKVLASKERSFELFGLGAWSGAIDIDLNSHVLMTRPIRRPRPGELAQLRKILLGEEQ